MTSFNPTKKHSDRERWICIYPAYINSRKTRKQGRLIPMNKAVDNPTPPEIRDVLMSQGLKFGIENKLYCREQSKEIPYRGRIRVQLKNDDGTPYHADYPTRESIMLMLGEMIPKLKSRVAKQSSSSGDQSQQQGGSSSQGGGKKKGKNRR